MFTTELHERVRALNTRVCLGIDPRPELHAHSYASGGAVGVSSSAGAVGAGASGGPSGAGASVAEAVATYFEHVLEATHDLLACCKPQSAFFEAMGVPGIEALTRVMAKARSLGLPVLFDAKRGDIDTTAAAYAAAYLEDGQLAADALTVNGYLGMDSIEPFIDSATSHGRGVFVLLKTSNPGSVDIQDLELASGARLYQHLAGLLHGRASRLPTDANGYTVLGVVVGATHAAHLAELRRAVPSSIMLVPGYGTQGGSAANVAAAFDEAGLGAVISASRSLTYSQGRSDTAEGAATAYPAAAHAAAASATADAAAAKAARAATLTMRDDINGALAGRFSGR